MLRFPHFGLHVGKLGLVGFVSRSRIELLVFGRTWQTTFLRFLFFHGRQYVLAIARGQPLLLLLLLSSLGLLLLCLKVVSIFSLCLDCSLINEF